MAGLPGKTVALGSPQSSTHQVSQPELADWMTEIEGLTGLSGFAFVRGSAAALSGLGSSGQYALVVTTAAERGIYERGASVWTKVADLPLILTESLAADQAEADRILAQAAAVSAGNDADAAAASATAAALSQSLADVARTQAQLAAVAAGATLYASVAAGVAGTVNGDVFLVSTEPGVQVYENDTGTGVFLGWLGEVLLDDVTAVIAWTPPAYPQTGLVLRTRKEGFAYTVLASGASELGMRTTAGGVKLLVLVAPDGTIPGDAFWAVGDGATSDTVAVQAAFDRAAELLTLTNTPVATEGRPFNRLVWSRKQYHLATPVNLPAHINVQMNGATFSAPDGGTIFTAVAGAYRWKWTGPGVFKGDDVRAIYAPGNNLNNAWFHFSHIDLSTQTRTLGNWAIDIESRSSRITFEEVNGRQCQFPIRTHCDFTYFNGGWYSGHVGVNAKPGGQGSFEFAGNDVHFLNTVMIPEPQGVTRADNARWIDKRCRKITFENVHFGGENAGVPCVYEFKRVDVDAPLDPAFTATYAQTLRSIDTSMTFRGCELRCGSTTRPDAAVIVLQDGVLPGNYTFQNCEDLAQGDLVSAYGYDAAGTRATQNAALRTAMQAAPAGYRTNLQIMIDQPDLTTDITTVSFSVPNCLRGYIVTPRTSRTISVFAPASDVAFPVFEVFRPNSLQTGQRAWQTYLVRVLLQSGADLTNMLMQETTFRVTLLCSSTSNMDARVRVENFYELGRTGAQEVGSNQIGFAAVGTPTSTYVRFEAEVSNLVVPASVQVSIISEGGGATDAIIDRAFAALYPVG